MPRRHFVPPRNDDSSIHATPPRNDASNIAILDDLKKVIIQNNLEPKNKEQ
ncbi:hypothetical protein [Rickettsia endosymbiont of Orchestes rusci]|uniref:hypothetical protein n=1 Tax=Rickettsia endosymbiont of Orchestes rusci TaxID=3066250 RepID=UPI00313B6654